VRNTALDTRGDKETPLVIPCSPSGPFVGLAFKLEEGRCVALYVFGEVLRKLLCVSVGLSKH